ncbi:MAG TPA: MBL fold metallo-hydrolase, partial [Aeromicrobium sp.]|nr:MBL fold metallo-hydrolase [Aeromicrobium sp.]
WLDLPGRPVPVVAPGHTSGHTMYHLPQHGVLVSGDALVTGHPISARRGPQLLDPMFHHDLAQNRGSLAVTRGLDADTILPGHGPLWRGGWSTAVDLALTP